ncbi:Homeodomain-like protein [Pilobolus umbonatus]|nr:Homeodomain-like protein [Pilobolus umbonatus]
MDTNVNSRRNSLSISALLNEDTVDPIHQLHTTPPSSPINKTKRKRITSLQYNRLMEVFDQTDTPSSEIRENLAAELDMTKREVQVWFQNRRAKMNRVKHATKHRPSLVPYYPSIKIRTQPIDTPPPPPACYPPPPPPPPPPSSSSSAIDLLASAAEYVRTNYPGNI